MAVRNNHDEYDWVFERNLLRRSQDGEENEGTSLQLKATLIELALTLGGFVGVILLIEAVLGAFR